MLNEGLGSLDPNVLPLDAFELQGTEGDTTRKMALKAPWVFSGETVQIGAQSLNDYIQDQINSSILAALPIGSVIAWPGSSIPTGWLLCNGQAHGSAVLQAVLGSANVPDYREVALVGAGTRASGVADHDVYTVNQMKDDQFETHKHASGYNTNDGYPGSGGGAGYQGGPATYTTGTSVLAPTSNGYTIRAGSVTRGKRIGVNWIIRKG